MCLISFLMLWLSIYMHIILISGTFLGTMYIQILTSWTWRPLLSSYWTSTKHTWESGIYCWNYVWIIQCSWVIHCCAGCPGVSCFLDFKTSRWTNSNGYCYWLGWWCYSCYPSCKCHVLSLFAHNYAHSRASSQWLIFFLGGRLCYWKLHQTYTNCWQRHYFLHSTIIKGAWSWNSTWAVHGNCQSDQGTKKYFKNILFKAL